MYHTEQIDASIIFKLLLHRYSVKNLLIAFSKCPADSLELHVATKVLCIIIIKNFFILGCVIQSYPLLRQLFGPV